MKASKEQLWKLWNQVLDALINYFETTQPSQLKASFVDVARQFLRDNGIRADSMSLMDMKQSAKELKELALPFQALPFTSKPKK